MVKLNVKDLMSFAVACSVRGRILLVAGMLVIGLAAVSFRAVPDAENVSGAWQLSNGGVNERLVFEDGYCAHTVFNQAGKQFRYTRGGTTQFGNDSLHITLEFHSDNKAAVGKKVSTYLKANKNVLVTRFNGKEQRWSKIDKGTTPLRGYWRINGRKEGESMNEIPLRPRKTIKLLSGSTFQWAAINIETGEFFGTGGGEYTFKDGKYTEHIQFFSRDNSRVGASLTFDGKVENGVWHHSGLSSKGDPIAETWIKMER